jgi:hypothetical protein
MKTTERLQHFAAMALIGDGVMALLHPKKDTMAWKKGPKVWNDLMHGLHRRPNLTRAIGAAQLLGAIWWAFSYERE